MPRAGASPARADDRVIGTQIAQAPDAATMIRRMDRDADGDGFVTREEREARWRNLSGH